MARRIGSASARTVASRRSETLLFIAIRFNNHIVMLVSDRCQGPSRDLATVELRRARRVLVHLSLYERRSARPEIDMRRAILFRLGRSDAAPPASVSLVAIIW